MSQVHPLARTTPRTRAEIKASPASATVLAERYNVIVATARKWKGREDVHDRSHRPHTLAMKLPTQEPYRARRAGLQEAARCGSSVPG